MSFQVYFCEMCLLFNHFQKILTNQRPWKLLKSDRTEFSTQQNLYYRFLDLTSMQVHIFRYEYNFLFCIKYEEKIMGNETYVRNLQLHTTNVTSNFVLSSILERVIRLLIDYNKLYKTILKFNHNNNANGWIARSEIFNYACELNPKMVRCSYHNNLIQSTQT